MLNTVPEKTGWRIRTVYDVGADELAGGRFSAQVRLLAATWRYWVEDRAAIPLEIVCVGGRAPHAVSSLTSLGVLLVAAPRPPAAVVGGTPNKLAGLLNANGDVPVLLVDNDCVFTGPLGLPPHANRADVMASVAGIAEVEPAQWQAVTKAVGAGPRQQEWIPLVEECAAISRQRPPRTNTSLYLNSGVVFARQPWIFGARWDHWITTIATLFEKHPLRSAALCKEDQVGLAIAVSEAEAFGLMPVEWNYRPPCFWLARTDAESIRIVHMTAMHWRAQDMPRGLRAMIDRFWEERILRPGGSAQGLKMSQRAREIAESVRTTLLDSVAAYLPEEVSS